MAGAGQHIDRLPFIHPLEVINKYGHFVKESCRLKIPSPLSAPLQKLDIKAEHGSSLSLFAATATTIGSFLQAERITLDWGYTQMVRAGDFLLSAGDDLVSMASQADLQLDRMPKRRRTDTPQGLLMVGLQHGTGPDAQFFISCVTAGTFIFDCLREHGFYLERFVVDDDGRLFGGDHRLWASGRFTILANDCFPSLALDLGGLGPLTGQPPFIGGPGGVDGGLGSHIIDKVLGDWISQIYASGPCPWRIDALWMNIDMTLRSFLTVVPDHTGEIFAPLAFRDHWALLYGCEGPEGWDWFYFDGIADFMPEAMTLLARRLAGLLKVDFLGVRRRRLVHQDDSYSCGTIALAHAATLLGLLGSFDPMHIQLIHAWLLEHLFCPGDLTARGPDVVAR